MLLSIECAVPRETTPIHAPASPVHAPASPPWEARPASTSEQARTLRVGETGTVKSVTVQAYLKQLPENASSIQAAFSAQTSALNMQDLLESKLDKLRKNLLGAPTGRQTVLFVDDINMPALETYA